MAEIRRKLQPILVMLPLFAVAIAFAIPAAAQVGIHYEGGELVIQNAGRSAQRAIRGVGKSSSGWFVEDQKGNSYEACQSTCNQNSDGTWTCSSFSSADNVSSEIIAGYSKVLQYLVDNHGAVVEHDQALELDYVSFPDAEDPYDLLATVLTTEYLDGRLLVEYFKAIEVSTIGVKNDVYNKLKQRGRPLEYPNDPFYNLQWNLDDSRLAEAQWHPFESSLKRPVRIGVIDSGIDEEDHAHPGLDGVGGIYHRWTAPTTGFEIPHALSLVSLLADKGNDNDGPVGLVGGWMACGRRTSVFERHPVEIYSYNVGDWGPVSYLVARAIQAAIQDDVDVINLSFRTAYSPLIEEWVESALAEGIIVVAAAGNYSVSLRQKPTAFPASIPGVVAVASSGKSGKVSRFSADRDYTVLAPGEDIVVGSVGNEWMYGNGTSFSAPHVVAIAALLKMADPKITPAEVSRVLTRSASKKGVIDALAALNSVLPKKQRVYNVHIPEDCDDDGEASKALLLASDSVLPETPVLHGSYPNPFNPTTTVRFALSADENVRFGVYDMLGRRVADMEREFARGENEISFSGDGLITGTYFYRLSGSGWELAGKMTLLK